MSKPRETAVAATATATANHGGAKPHNVLGLTIDMYEPHSSLQTTHRPHEGNWLHVMGSATRYVWRGGRKLAVIDILLSIT